MDLVEEGFCEVGVLVGEGVEVVGLETGVGLFWEDLGELKVLLECRLTHELSLTPISILYCHKTSALASTTIPLQLLNLIAQKLDPLSIALASRNLLTNKRQYNLIIGDRLLNPFT